MNSDSLQNHSRQRNERSEWLSECRSIRHDFVTFKRISLETELRSNFKVYNLITWFLNLYVVRNCCAERRRKYIRIIKHIKNG